MSVNKALDKTGLTYLWSKIVSYLQNAFPNLGNTPMGTEATTITGAIAEHTSLIGDTAMGTTADTLTGAIAEHEADINDLQNRVITYDSPTAFSVANNTETVLATIEIPPGRYVIRAGATWSYNSSGYRYIFTGNARYSKDLRDAVAANSKETYTLIGYITKFESTSTITLKGFQNSGSSLTVYPFIQAIKIS